MWTLDGAGIPGELDGVAFPLTSQSATYTMDSVINSTVASLDGVGDSLDLGGQPGTCLTSLEFCVTLNVFFLMTFTGPNTADQYVIATTAHDSSMAGFYFRYANFDPRLPFRRYYEASQQIVCNIYKIKYNESK